MKLTIVNPIIKDTVIFLEISEESGGKISEGEITLLPSGGNPMHYHNAYSKIFKAVDCELVLKLSKKETKILKAGESFTVEPMSLHSFFNLTGKKIKFNVKRRPGHIGIENSLRIIYGRAGNGLTEKKNSSKKHKTF